WLYRGQLSILGRERPLPAFAVPAATLAFTCVGVFSFSKSGNPYVGSALILFASFFYEVFALIAFEAIGALSKKPGRVALTFGIMGVVATGFYLALSMSGASLTSLVTIEVTLSFLAIGIFALSSYFDRQR